MSLSSVDQASDAATTVLDPGLKTNSILEEARASSAAITTSRPSKVHPWVKEAIHLLRRGHLYAGLLLLPWVFLYGITGFLFNHPTWFTDQTILSFGRVDTEGTPLARIPNAGEIAEQVVAALNARNGGRYRLVNPPEARFERGGLSGSVTAGGKTYAVTLNADGDGGTVREGANRAAGQAATLKAGRREGSGAEAKGEGRGGRDAGKREGRGEGRGGEIRGERNEAPGSPFDLREGLLLAASPLVPLEQGLPTVLARLGLPDAKVSEVRAAPLSFLMEAAGQRWLVSYTLANGAVAGRLADSATVNELSTRRFLTGLHTSHGYPETFGPRWIWAVIVDIMSGIMVFWGVSGLVMWWQIKRTRRLGAVLLGLSVVAALYVGMGMRDAMATAGR